jgi:hypothetical protein
MRQVSLVLVLVGICMLVSGAGISAGMVEPSPAPDPGYCMVVGAHEEPPQGCNDDCSEAVPTCSGTDVGTAAAGVCRSDPIKYCGSSGYATIQLHYWECSRRACETSGGAPGYECFWEMGGNYMIDTAAQVSGLPCS